MERKHAEHMFFLSLLLCVHVCVCVSLSVSLLADYFTDGPKCNAWNGSMLNPCAFSHSFCVCMRLPVCVSLSLSLSACRTTSQTVRSAMHGTQSMSFLTPSLSLSLSLSLVCVCVVLSQTVRSAMHGTEACSTHALSLSLSLSISLSLSLSLFNTQDYFTDGPKQYAWKGSMLNSCSFVLLLCVHAFAVVFLSLSLALSLSLSLFTTQDYFTDGPKCNAWNASMLLARALSLAPSVCAPLSFSVSTHRITSHTVRSAMHGTEACSTHVLSLSLSLFPTHRITLQTARSAMHGTEACSTHVLSLSFCACVCVCLSLSVSLFNTQDYFTDGPKCNAWNGSMLNPWSIGTGKRTGGRCVCVCSCVCVLCVCVCMCVCVCHCSRTLSLSLSLSLSPLSLSISLSISLSLSLSGAQLLLTSCSR